MQLFGYKTTLSNSLTDENMTVSLCRYTFYTPPLTVETRCSNKDCPFSLLPSTRISSKAMYSKREAVTTTAEVGEINCYK